jgi:hypothetical protein
LKISRLGPPIVFCVGIVGGRVGRPSSVGLGGLRILPPAGGNMGFKYSDEDGLRRLILRYVREWNKRMPLEPSNYLIVILDDVDEAPIEPPALQILPS